MKTVEECFPNDIENHTMEICLDTSTHRHLKFSNNGSSTLAFEIITWPKYLTICGDMGTFTFWRTDDMFKFFRGSGINPSYWTQKLESTDKRLGHKKFSRELFMKSTVEDISEQDFDNNEERVRIIDNFEDHMSLADSNDVRMYDALSEWEFEGHKLEAFESMDHAYEIVYQYEWCLHAIVWAIKQYDAQRHLTESALPIDLYDMITQKSHKLQWATDAKGYLTVSFFNETLEFRDWDEEGNVAMIWYRRSWSPAYMTDFQPEIAKILKEKADELHKLV